MAVEMRGVSVRYGESFALRGVDLSIEPGERVALLGASGAGKSTLLAVLSSLVQPDDGAVEVLGHNLSDLRGKRLREHRRNVGLITQHLDMALTLRVVHNVNAGRLGQWSNMAALGSLLWPLGRGQAAAVLDEVGLADRLLDRTDSLSGGERQRVAVARVLRHRPSLVLADEPTSSVDPSLAARVMELLCSPRACRSSTHEGDDPSTVVVSVHDPHLARHHATRLIGLSDGAVVFDRGPNDVSEADLTELYASTR